MSKVESKLKEECRKDPDQVWPVVITVLEGFDRSVAEELGLSEILGMNIYCGSLDGKTVLSLDKKEDIIKIEKDLEASIMAV